MIWDKKYECMDREQLRGLQSERLVKVVQRVYDQVPFYRQLFEQEGIEPTDIKGVEDISKLPFTTKDALRDNYPFGLFAEPMNKIVRLHASSGTTGKPIVVGYTQKDLNTWAELIARIVSQAGVTEEDVVQICFGYGLFTGGFGLHYGLEKVGTTIIPASVGNTRRQIMLMEDFGTTVLVSTPSYALYMAEVIQESGIDLDRLKMRIGLFGAEPWSESMREQIQAKWGITATDNYGLSEIIGPGVSGECLEFKGLHISEDHFIPEIIDPVTGESLGFGQEGELVFTTLTKEGFPVIRYRTKDISILWDDVCACGRTTARMKKVTGRTDDMMIIRGVNVFPSQIESVLMEVKGLAPIYQIIVDRKGHLDNIEVQVEMEKEMFTGSFRDLEAMENKIRGKLNTVLSIDVRVKLVEPKTIQRSEGKAKRVIDKRQI
ncbi:phenylacetate--CoA ligase family protein [Candidatus Contubernalis alkaliaceticus]|uniref:phenylacetate--CoA ligase family protein n=1 Tax=Candidatus Contubernalis alkaliaceticus TaxID=338645 RepID=UPI001F4C1A90|nr:phenylacetate--CoA ligase [Candidatus Contubernalis alkalaceticus]UNC93419.1 phenylacetate--CoA ligase [Candidatus Contubernalis alkalaceticus]